MVLRGKIISFKFILRHKKSSRIEEEATNENGDVKGKNNFYHPNKLTNEI